MSIFADQHPDGMIRFSLLIAFFLISVTLAAQKNYFIFIQHEAGKPFYVRMGEKNHSSTEAGHMILSGLHDSAYQFYIGFPRNIIPEQLFAVELHGKDRGFELKNTDGQWQLSDMQTAELIKSAPVEPKRLDSSLVRKMDSYSELMAGVVNDSIVLYAAAVKPDSTLAEAIKLPVKGKKIAVPVPLTASAKDSTHAIAAQPAGNYSVTAPVVAETKSSANGNISRYSSENKVEGKEIIYLDKTSAVADTIRILIPRL